MKIDEIPIGTNTVIMGVGNPLRGDDGIGAFVAQELIKKGLKRVFNCCEVPENYLSKVCSLNPDVVLIVDAVNIREAPGTIKLLKAEDVSGGITTHNAGLDILQEFIKNSCNSEVYVVAVQPGRLQGNMSDRVKEAGEKIINIIGKKLFI